MLSKYAKIKRRIELSTDTNCEMFARVTIPPFILKKAAIFEISVHTIDAKKTKTSTEIEMKRKRTQVCSGARTKLKNFRSEYSYYVSEFSRELPAPPPRRVSGK